MSLLRSEARRTAVLSIDMSLLERSELGSELGSDLPEISDVDKFAARFLTFSGSHHLFSS